MKRSALVVSLVLGICAGGAASQSGAARDARISQAVIQAMAKSQGTAVVLDVATGKLIAASRMDVASRTLVRPGSTIKPFTLMALLDSGVVRPQTSFLCRKSVRIQGRTLDCSHVDVPEPIDGVMALAYSCNHFFMKAAESVQPEVLTRAFRESGLASRTGLAADEAAGAIHSPGSRESVQLMAIGEDGVQVTPLGLAGAYRRLALRLKKNDAAVKPVLEGLSGSVQFGTGQLAKTDGVFVAGKTGTSPAADRLRTNAWFAGFAPADRPEIVVVVFLEQGTGGADAAPIAGRIFAAYR